MYPIPALLLLTSATGAPPHPVAVSPIRQDTLTVREAEPGLKALARVGSATAMRTALARVPGGKIREAELEKEHGRLVYSFDITASKQSGVEEVLVDAATGAVVLATHESAAVEAREHAAETKPAMRRDSAK